MRRIDERRQPSYLPKRIVPCPQCGDRDHVQIVVVGMPVGPPSAEEDDRVYFAGCIASVNDPDWYCPACDLGYTKKGVIVG